MITNAADKSESQLRVEVFMAQMRSDMQAIPTAPTIPNPNICKLRSKLMIEETLETINKGCGVSIFVKVMVKVEGKEEFEERLVEVKEDNLVFSSDRQCSLIELADGLADIDVVGPCGTASAFGIAHAPIKKIIDASNLMKFGPGHFFREDGKLMKSPSFVPPTDLIAAELRRQGGV